MAYTKIPISNGNSIDRLTSTVNYVYNTVTFSMNAAGQGNTNSGINSLVLGGTSNQILSAPDNSLIAVSDFCTTDSERTVILASEATAVTGIGSGSIGCFNCAVTGDHNLCLSVLSNINGDRNIALGGSGHIIVGDDNVTYGQNSQVTGNGCYCATGVGFGSNSLTTSNAISFCYLNGAVISNIQSQQPVASAILTLNSITKGLLQPRNTTSGINSIASPAEGLSAYDTTIHSPKYFDGTAWQAIQAPVANLVSQTFYVSPNGNNVSGTGSILKPYQTIAFAQTFITDASQNIVILLLPGIYSENISLKPNVMLYGFNPSFCEITGTLDINDPLWGAGGTLASGIQNISIEGAVNIDFTTHSAAGAQFSILGGQLENSINYVAFDETDMLIISQTLINAPVTINGGTFICIGIPQNFSPTFTINSASGFPTTILFDGAAFGGSWVIDYTNGDGSMFVSLGATDSLGLITVDASTGSSGGSITLTGSACAFNTPINYLNDGAVATDIHYLDMALAIGYTPDVPGNWTVQPTTTQQALDMIAAKIGPV